MFFLKKNSFIISLFALIAIVCLFTKISLCHVDHDDNDYTEIGKDYFDHEHGQDDSRRHEELEHEQDLYQRRERPEYLEPLAESRGDDDDRHHGEHHEEREGRPSRRHHNEEPEEHEDRENREDPEESRRRYLNPFERRQDDGLGGDVGRGQASPAHSRPESRAEPESEREIDDREDGETAHPAFDESRANDEEEEDTDHSVHHQRRQQATTAKQGLGEPKEEAENEKLVYEQSSPIQGELRASSEAQQARPDELDEQPAETVDGSYDRDDEHFNKLADNQQSEPESEMIEAELPRQQPAAPVVVEPAAPVDEQQQPAPVVAAPAPVVAQPVSTPAPVPVPAPAPAPAPIPVQKPVPTPAPEAAQRHHHKFGLKSILKSVKKKIGKK